MTNDRRYDLVIRNGTLIDGTGAPARPADLGIAGGRLAAPGDLGDAHWAVAPDAAGRLVAPGFIDVHTHDDNALPVQPDLTYTTRTQQPRHGTNSLTARTLRPSPH